MNFTELQKIFKDQFGIDHLADIARELQVSPQAVSNWKSRDRVPYKYVLNVRNLKKGLVREDQNSEKKSNNIAPEAYDLDSNYNTISLIDVLFILAKNFRYIIIIPSILCFFMIINVQFIAKSVYISSAKIMSSNNSSSPPQANMVNSILGIDIFSSGGQSEWVYPEIIKSRTLARSLLKRKFDTEEWGKNKSLLQILTYGHKKPRYSRDTLEVLAIQSLHNMIEVTQKNSIYRLSVSASEPKFAANLTSAIIYELDMHQREYNTAKISEARDFIEERLIVVEKELEVSEEELKDFRDRNRRIGNSPNLLLEQERLVREVSVMISVFTTLKQQLETTKIEEVKDSEYVQVLDPPEAPLERSKPRKKLMVILTGIIGLVIGVMVAFIVEYINRNKDKDNKQILEIKSLLEKNIEMLFNIRYYLRFNQKD